MSEIGHNSRIDAEAAQRWVGEILKHMDTLDTYKGEHMKRCKDVRELISDCYDRAKDAGLPKRELKALVKRIVLERKIQEIDEIFEEPELYQELVAAFGEAGDLPIFAAALERAKEAEPKDDGLANLGDE